MATRRSVGGKNGFYNNSLKRNLTFKEMVNDAMCVNCTAESEEKPINLTEKGYTYSYVLQHPMNRIVSEITEPTLVLVAVYKTENSDETTTVHEVPAVLNNPVPSSRLPIHYTIGIHNAATGNTLDDLLNAARERFASQDTPYECKGVVLHNTRTGQRTKIRNPVYESVRKLRGNQSKLQYQYLSLRAKRDGSIQKYLEYFPENQTHFNAFREQVHSYTNTLHGNYLDCFVRKTKKLNEYTPQYKQHMYKLHKLYINTLKSQKKRVTLHETIKYINLLKPAQLMYAVNYHLRKSKPAGQWKQQQQHQQYNIKDTLEQSVKESPRNLQIAQENHSKAEEFQYIIHQTTLQAEKNLQIAQENLIRAETLRDKIDEEQTQAQAQAQAQIQTQVNVVETEPTTVMESAAC
jgi:hypothetical protein